MAERKRAAEAPQVRPIFEVLTRNPLGRESVHRHRADDEADARRQVLDLGVPEDQVVEVRQVTAS